MLGRFTVPLPTTTPRACVVCAKPLDWSLPLTPRRGLGTSAPRLYPLCIDPACCWIFEQAGASSDAEFRLQLRWRAQAWGTWRERIQLEQEERARLLSERSEVEAREHAAAFAAIARREKTGSPPALQLVVPSGRRPSRPLPQRRRRAYGAHLDKIIAAAVRAAGPAAEAPPVVFAQSVAGRDTNTPDSQLPGRLCGTCGGGCCPRGGDQAYLSEGTIRRVMAEDPGLDPERLRALYLAHLPARTMSGSCVHHTRQGCSLPRSLRSDICNRYACSALVTLLTALEADPPVGAAAVLRRRQNRWNQNDPMRDNDIVGAAVLTETATRELRRPAPEGWA